MDINIDALYNILKQNQGDINDALGYKKKAVVVTSDPLALIADETLLEKTFNRKKYYAKPTNNNLRTSSASSSANKKLEYVKSVEKKEDKKVDEKKRDMSKEINANMVFMAKMEKVLSDSDESSSSAEETIAEKCGYKKDKCELNYKFLNNLQPEWKQYGTLMRQTKNLMDINIDALYNILKQNQGDINDALGYKKKAVVVTSDPLALIADESEQTQRES
nr:hypothetical protein [Tanacetum cinerariifolium]